MSGLQTAVLAVAFAAGALAETGLRRHSERLAREGRLTWSHLVRESRLLFALNLVGVAGLLLLTSRPPWAGAGVLLAAAAAVGFVSGLFGSFVAARVSRRLTRRPGSDREEGR